MFYWKNKSKIPPLPLIFWSPYPTRPKYPNQELKKPWGSDIALSNPCGDQATHFKIALKVLTLEQMWGYVTILFVTTGDYMSFAITFATIFASSHQFHRI
jgi:hypothetical protein